MTGRNDPCACASGKKFKKCCGDPSRPPRGHFVFDVSPSTEPDHFAESPYWDPMLSIVAERDDKYDIGGTGFFIAPGLALTASHLLRGGPGFHEALSSLPVIDDAPSQIDFNVFGTSIHNNAEYITRWRVKSFVTAGQTDIAFLVVEPQTALPAGHRHSCLALDLFQPAPGTNVEVRGFPEQTMPEFLPNTTTLSQQLTTRTAFGVVEEYTVHDRGTHLKFPHLQSSVKLEGGMSGAPYIDTKTGRVVGVGSRGWNLSDEHEDVSFAATWMALLRAVIPVRFLGQVSEPPHTLLSLAAEGVIEAANWDGIEFVPHPDGGDMVHSRRTS